LFGLDPFGGLIWGIEMQAIRRSILCAGAVLLTASGAEAADLPVHAKAIEYVRVCSLYGAGFWYIPGTETCIRVGGYMRIDTTFNGGVFNAPAWNGDIGAEDRYSNEITTRARMALTVDTRTATEYGLVRTYVQADLQFSTLANTTANPTSLATNLGNNPTLFDTPGGGYAGVEVTFLQFAGFTFGKSVSAYATPWRGYPGNNTSFLLGGHDSTTGVANIQYTAELGSGITASVGLDDPSAYDRTIVNNLSVGLNAVGVGANAYGGVWMPDPVARARIDQAWGVFQISGALHEVNGSYNTLGAGAVSTAASELSGHPDTKIGGSAMVGLQIKNFPTGPGDDLTMDASWAKGDTKNVVSTSGASPSFAMFGSSNVGYRSVGFGETTDGVWLPTSAGGDGSIHLTTSFGGRGALNHNFNAYWSSSLFATYSAVRLDPLAQTMYCNAYYAAIGAGNRATSTCNPNFNVTQFGGVLRWTPVRDLAFSVEVMWDHLDQNFTGKATLTPAAPLPTAVYQFKNQDTASVNIRAQRNF
jgi:hypothetical protein